MILVPYESGLPGWAIADLLVYYGIESWGFDFDLVEMIFFVKSSDHKEAVTLLVQNGITYYQEMPNVNRNLVFGIIGGSLILLSALIMGLLLSLTFLD